MSATTTYRNALPLGAMLNEYRLESVLGAGAFGMTYLAWDTHLEKHVAIKEYLPTDLAVRALDGSVLPVTTDHGYDYQWGLERFLQEARTLARFSHPNIVRVNRYFEANGTACVVMDYEQGASLAEVLKRELAPDDAGLRAILLPLLDGLEAVHAAGFLHRDIKPANVFIRANGAPVLLDFGAARQALGGATKSLTSVLTPGYAPLEQYSSDGNQGPWSDIYALAGVVYRALTRENPPDAVSRMRHDAVSEKLSAARGRAGESLLGAVQWALTMDEKLRPQSVADWRRAVLGQARLPASGAAGASPGAPAAQAAPASLAATQPAFPRTAPAQRAPLRPPGGRAAGQHGFPWRWVAVAIVLAAVVVWVAWVAVGNRQRQPGGSAGTPSARNPADKAWEGTKPWPKPGAKQEPPPEGAGTAPDRPTRERTDRPGDPGPDTEQLRKQAVQEFQGADADGDGFLSRDEVRRFPFITKAFDRVDTDGDGRLSLQEFVLLRRMQAQQRSQK